MVVVLLAFLKSPDMVVVLLAFLKVQTWLLSCWHLKKKKQKSPDMSRILYGAYSGTKVPVGTTLIHYTKVPVGTTGLIYPEGHIFVPISDSYTYTGILIHVLVLITDIYLSNLL